MRRALSVSFRPVVCFAEHFAIFEGCISAFAPGCYVVGLHVLQCPNLCAVCAVPDGTMRAVGDTCLPRSFRLHSIDLAFCSLIEDALFQQFEVRTSTQDEFEDARAVFDIRVSI